MGLAGERVGRRVRRLAGPLLVAAALTPAPASRAADAPLAGHVTGQSPEEVRAHWTPARMAAAQPLDPPVAGFGAEGGAGATTAAKPPDQETDPARDTLYPERIHGKLFVSFGLTDGVCSATVARSFTRNLIVTAGHCVVSPPATEGGEPTWASNVMFVPGYRNNNRPFGTYVGVRARAPVFWAFEGDISVDVGTINLAPGPDGRRIQPRLGSRGVTFNLLRSSYPGRRFTLFGYPARPLVFYDGERLIRCVSPFAGFERFTRSPLAAPCNMQQGSSGGAWVIRGGLLNSVISHNGCGVDPNCDVIAGTYFGDIAFRLWAKSAGGIPAGRKRKLRRCKRIRNPRRKLRCRSRAQTFKPTIP